MKSIRLLITIAIFFKFLGNLAAAAVGRTQFSEFDPDETTVGRLAFWGLLFLEFPPYVISTVYTLFLLFCLLTCRELLPHRYGLSFRTMLIISIIYNISSYLIFITSVVLIAIGSRAHVEVYSVGAVTRDLLLSLIYAIFYCSHRLWLREIETYATMEESMFRSAWVLALLLLLRGILPFTQGILILTQNNSQKSECGAGFLTWWALSELCIEAFPMWYLIRASNAFSLELHLDDSDRRMMFLSFGE
jgi:glucan phosphoethanolaminetransferase (alkaline phosphatase superfamily)